MNADCVVGDAIDVLVVNRSGFLEFGLLGCFASLLCGSVTLAPWLLGFMASWLHGFVASWLLGFLASWLLGFMGL